MATDRPETERFRRGIHTDEDQIGLLNGFFRIGGKEEISIANLSYYFVQTRLEETVRERVEFRSAESYLKDR